MFSFLKPKQSGADIASGLFQSIRESYNAGFPQCRKLFPEDAQIGSDAVRQEWLYLEIFSIDYAAYVALGMTPAKAQLLTPFWTFVRTWLQLIQVRELPARFAVVGGGPRSTPSEPSETAFARLSRRTQDYASAVTSPHPQGQSYSVAAVFAATCGTMDSIAIVGVAASVSFNIPLVAQALGKVRIAS